MDDLHRLIEEADLPAIAGGYCDDLKPDGREFIGCCPFHAERTPSFTLYRNDRWRFKCFGCGAQGDALDFLQEAESCDRAEAIKRLRGDVEAAPTRRHLGPPPEAIPVWRAICPVPSSAPPLDLSQVWNPKRGRFTSLRPTMQWEYLSAERELLGYVVRCEFGDGGKWTPQITYARTDDGQVAWCLVPLPTPRPLYGLQHLREHEGKPVMVVEGEKAATAAQRLLPGWVVVTWPGGTQGAKHTDWKALAGRDVVLWPDADEPGHAVADEIARTIYDAAKRVRMLDVAEFPKGHDAADLVAAGWTTDRFVAWARTHVMTFDPTPAVKSAEADRSPRPPRLSVVGGSAAPARDPEPAADPEAIPPEYSDDSLALAFTARYPDLRFVAAWGRWYRWDGLRWAEDDTYRVWNDARQLCRRKANEAVGDILLTAGKRDAIAKSVTSSKTIAAVVTLARVDRQHAATTGQWDTDIWALNTPAGVVDLRTGRIRPADPNEHHTKITAVSPSGDCPGWKAFLLRVLGGDQSLVDYLQRVAGYCLTGSTREHAMWFVHGPGGNGKGTFLNTLCWIMGDYAMTSPMETFADSRHERHPTELAMLRGARLVVAQETEEGQRWAESRIKALTGGDPITARFMRQDHFTFQPQFKLIIAGNHKPALRAPDEAIRRRFNLVPFDAIIPADERDPDLPDRLRAEAGGILAWAVEGCRLYLKDRLAPPRAVTEATNEYLEDEDPFAMWIEEACDTSSSIARTPAAELSASYRDWCEKAGQGAMARKRWAANIERLGFVPYRSATARGYEGIRVGFIGYRGQ